MSLANLTRRAFLASAVAGAATLLMPRAAAAKPLEELTASNFSRQVYHNPKPVVVLFYEAETDLKNDGSLEPSHRMLQIVEELADKYKGQVSFFRVAVDHDGLTKYNFERTFDVPDYSPLTVLYSRFDVLSGRQLLHNQKIDVARGGPPSDEGISATSTNTDYWIQQNLFRRSPDGDSKLYRYEDTLKIHEVGELR